MEKYNVDDIVSLFVKKTKLNSKLHNRMAKKYVITFLLIT